MTHQLYNISEKAKFKMFKAAGIKPTAFSTTENCIQSTLWLPRINNVIRLIGTNIIPAGKQIRAS